MPATQRALRQFIEDAGDMLGEHGLPHMAGRVVGSLLVSEPRFRSLDELAEDLGASKGSISMATQLLLRLELIEKISVPGERRHFYQIRSGVWARVFTHREAHLRRDVEVLEEGLALLEGQPIETKQRLLELLAFLDFVVEESPGFVSRWEMRRSELLDRRMMRTHREER